MKRFRVAKIVKFHLLMLTTVSLWKKGTTIKYDAGNNVTISIL